MSLLGNPTQITEDPRNETFLDMLRRNMSSNLTIDRLSLRLVMVLLVVFLLQVIIDGLERSALGFYFLPIDVTGSLTSTLGCRYDDFMLVFPAIRYVTALFLNQNAEILLGNCLQIIIWVTLVETMLPPTQVKAAFLAGGGLGYALGLLGSPSTLPFLGTSPGTFGVFGGAVGHLIFNWRNMDKAPQLRSTWGCWLVMIIIFSVFFGGSRGVPPLVLLAAYCCGMLVTISFPSPYEGAAVGLPSPYEKTMTTIARVTLAAVIAFLIGIRIASFFTDVGFNNP
jgi:membrane associated rhomboid family serine protease